MHIGQRGASAIHHSLCPRTVSHLAECLVPEEIRLIDLVRYNIKNPAGDFAQRESNVEVVRQLSQARVKAEKAAAEEERARRAEAGEVVTDVRSRPLRLLIRLAQVKWATRRESKVKPSLNFHSRSTHCPTSSSSIPDLGISGSDARQTSIQRKYPIALPGRPMRPTEARIPLCRVAESSVWRKKMRRGGRRSDGKRSKARMGWTRMPPSTQRRRMRGLGSIL